ncbi:Protection of telomeres protein [Dirofilaria immitis]
MKEYQYITLAELDELPHTADENLKINIYAFVTDSKTRSQQTDVLEDVSVITQLELRDDSTNIDTTCVIYSDPLENFSDQIQAGQIIRMHRAKIKEMANGKLLIYGKLKAAGFAILLFSGQIDGSLTPLYQSSAKYTIELDYKKRIIALRKLFMRDQSMILESQPTTSQDPRIPDGQLIATTSRLPVNQIVTYANEEEINEIIKNANIHPLNELVLGGYSDICIQVIALFIGDRNNVVLRCWDTTSPPRKIFTLNADFIHEVICRNEKMEMAAANYWCDIVLYEEHANFARNNVKCGDILLLINMHLYHSKSGVTLTMHGGGRCYKRSIIILDDNSELKSDLLRNIDGFNPNKVSLYSVVQAETEHERDVENVEQQHMYMDVQQIDSTRSFDELNDLTNQQKELWKCWAGERMRHIHAVQLAWIRSYVWKKKQQTDVHLQRSFNLARMAIQFTIRQFLLRLFDYNKDLFANLVELPRRQWNTLFIKFLLTYMEGTYGDALTSNLTDQHKQSVDKHKQAEASEGRKDENLKKDVIWSLLCSLLPGTVLKLSGWQIDFSYNSNTKIFFALICNTCNLWCTTSAKNFDVTPLCPVCFKRDITDSHLFLQCYFLFDGTPHEAEVGSKKHYFLFPIQLLAFFLVDVPESAQEAAHNYRKGVSDNQRKALAASIQEQMLCKYIFILNEVIVRKIKAGIAILEVGKLTFMDR